MSDLYTMLHVSPKKKRCPPDADDERVLTPKRLRAAPLTPPPTIQKRIKSNEIALRLPDHLQHLYNVQTALQNALSHALATCAVSPSSETGLVRNVLNHLSLATYAGLTMKFGLDDLRRLCWLWEWDGESSSIAKNGSEEVKDEDENPFLDPKPSNAPKEWTRGSMGLVLSPTTHFSKSAGKRIPVYGIGIEVEMDIDKGMAGGMAAVARWTSDSETRRKAVRRKLEGWMKYHKEASPVPLIPLAELPPLPSQGKVSALTQTLALSSPKGLSSFPLSSPSVSPSKLQSITLSPSKKATLSRGFAVPLPVTPSTRSSVATRTSTIPFPQTPSSRHGRVEDDSSLVPRTPSTSVSSAAPSEPSTPSSQRGSGASTVPQTPVSSRRQALYERVRQRSLTASPTKPSRSQGVVGGKLTREQILKLGQEEMRRRCLLGRLGGIAESVWMLFSNPVGSTSTPTGRKRRTLPSSEIIPAVVKSSPVPISSAEAHESLNMLTKLCPFFLKSVNIAREQWFEMPASSIPDDGASGQPPSPSRFKGKDESAEEIRTRSPRTVKRETGGLREVREIIRRELELQD